MKEDNKGPEHDWKAELRDGEWYKHFNEVTVLRHMSAGEQMPCPSGMGRTAIRTTSGTI